MHNTRSVTIGAAPVAVDFGTLRTGDANDDDGVSIQDFSLLSAAFATCQPAGGFDARTDFNADHCVDLRDFSLLSANFGQTGDSPATLHDPAAPDSGPVVLQATADKHTVGVGDTFQVTVAVQAAAQNVDAVAAYLDFDPAALQLLAITPGEALPTVLQNTYDNQAGQANFAAGLLGAATNGSFTVATLTFQAIAATPAAHVDFTTVAPRLSDVAFDGASVLGQVEAAPTITVVPSVPGPWQVLLPLLQK